MEFPLGRAPITCRPSSAPSTAPEAALTMKIAYLVMLHQGFDQAKWILSAIKDPEDHVIIHIDKRADETFRRQIRAYLDGPNVTYLRSRRVNRFGWSIVETELRAIEVFAALDGYSYLVNLSGSDYPLKPRATIKAELANAWPRSFLQIVPFDQILAKDPEAHRDNHLQRKFSIEIFGRLLRTQIRLPFPDDLDVRYKGCNWFMFTQEFCRWMLASPLTRRVKRLIKYTWGPDELFFQVLTMNSSRRADLTEHCRREMTWRPGTSSPITYTMRDYDHLSSSAAFFARKFDHHIDREILARLARDHGYPIPA